MIDYKRQNNQMVWVLEEIDQIKKENEIFKKLITFYAPAIKPTDRTKFTDLYPCDVKILMQFNGHPLQKTKITGNPDTVSTTLGKLTRLGYLKRVDRGTYQRIQHEGNNDSR